MAAPGSRRQVADVKAPTVAFKRIRTEPMAPAAEVDRRYRYTTHKRHPAADMDSARFRGPLSSFTFADR